MSYNIHITRTAEQDISEAADYIEFSLPNPIAADALLDEIETQINALADFPEQFELADDPVLNSWGIRFTTIKNYLAFYVIDDEKQIIHIIRFLYGKRDWLPILRGGYSLD